MNCRSVCKFALHTEAGSLVGFQESGARCQMGVGGGRCVHTITASELLERDSRSGGAGSFTVVIWYLR
jgi:hypothetical protein